MKLCLIPVPREECEDKRIQCRDCPHKDECDYAWVEQLWKAENKLNGKNSLLGPITPNFVKPDFRNNHVISVTGKYDFCCFNAPKSKDVVVIGDIYVDDAARGQHISTQIINYLMETYDRDIFAKCVRGTSAEDFWRHVGEQIPATQNTSKDDLYEHPIGKDGKPKRDLGWYRVVNKNKKSYKQDLW